MAALPILLPRAARWPGPERATARRDRPAVRFLLGFGTQSLRLNHIRFLATTFTAHHAAAAHLIMVSTLPDHLDCSAEGSAFFVPDDALAYIEGPGSEIYYQFKYLNLAVLRTHFLPDRLEGTAATDPPRPAGNG